MSDHFADRITHAVKAKGTCAIVGIDPVYSLLPKQIIDRQDLNDEQDVEAAIDAIFEFSTKVLRIVAPLVPAVKFNSAFFEKYYWEGVETYYSLIQEADELGVETIGDVKRGDIGSTATAYAEAHLKNPEFMDMESIVAPDAITINAFAGAEGILPFANVANEQGKGIFAWVRSSNPTATVLQDFANADGKKFFEVLAEVVNNIACEPQRIGQSGFSNVGMVVAGTAADVAQQLRKQYPQSIFLVPGYGAQGASAQECMKFAKPDGSGVLVNASRSIIYAFNNDKYKQKFGANWEKCIEQACLDMKEQLNQAIA